MTESPVELSRTVVGNMTEEKPIRVLHVDDDASFLKTSKAILEMPGLFQVENATSIEEATEKMKKEEYDAIICDYQMPGKDGLEFLRELRQKGNTIPFVIFTGRGREEVAIRALNLGADGYFNKTGQPETVYGELAHGIRGTVKSKQAEQALKVSEEKYRSLFANVLNGFAYCRMMFDEENNPVDFVYLEVNDAFEKLTGLRKEDVIGKKVTEAIPGTEKANPELFEIYGRVALTGKEEKFEIFFKPLNIWLSISVHSPRKGYFVAAFENITKRKKAEEALQKNEAELKAQFEGSPDLIMILDRDYRFVRINRILFGSRTVEELIGQDAIQTVPPEEREWIKGKIDQCFATGTVQEFEHAMGEGKWARARIVPLQSAGVVSQAMVISSDITSRKRAEEALVESEERLRQLVENAPDAIYVNDLDGNFIDGNRQAELLTGYKREELVGRNILKTGILQAKSAPTVMQDLTKNLEGQGTGPAVYELKKKDGSNVTLEISTFPVKREGKVEVIGIARDITESRKIVEQLEESEARYRELFETSIDAIATSDMDGHFLDCNQTCQTMLGYTLNEMRKLTYQELTPEKWRPKEEEIIREQIMKKGFTVEYEKEVIRKDGSTIPVSNRVWATFDENRKPKAMWGILRDITERKKAEDALRKSEEKFRNLFDSANDAMVYLDGSGRILDVNFRTVEMFGGTREELIGKQFTELGLFSFKETPELMRNLVNILAGSTTNLNLTMKNKKGQQMDLECSASLMKSDESTSIVVVVRDISERKKAEQRIKESEERFRQVTDNAQEWIWEVDGKGLYTFASPVVTKILGYRPEEIVGKKHFYDLIVPEERKVLKKAALQVFAQKQPFTRLLNSNLHKNGNTIVLETSGTPILDSQGMLLGYRGVDTDVTERKNAEKSLRESEDKFKALFDKAGEGLVYLDLKGTIVDINQRATEIAGIKRDKLVGRSFMNLGLVSLRDVPMLLGRLRARLGGDTSGLIELTIGRENGEKRSIEVNSTIVRKNNRPVGRLAIVRDITERKKAEQSIVESHQKFAALFSGNPEATVYADPDMHILDVNPRFIRLFGYPLEEVKGKRLDDIVVPKSLVEEGKMLGEKASKGLVYHDTFRMKKDGSLVPVSVSAAPISIQGHLAGYIATYKDISALKKTEKELKETLRRLEVMNEKLLVVGGLTRHDARNKLTAILGNTYLVKKKVPEDSAVSEYLEEIETSVKQTTAIFEFAKTYESLGVEDLKYIDVEKTIDEAVSLMPDLKGVKIINQCGGLTVLADSLLRQLFYNLIDNSLKYGEKIRQIRTFYEETRQGQLKLVYEDDGVGIQFDAKPKLFSRGYTTGKGSGYGLYFIKKMMEVYGWTIEEKGKPSEGARFVIKIPKTSESGKTGYALR